MKKIDYNTYQKPSDYVKFPQGDTTIRIISSGGLVKKHGLRMGGKYVPLGDCTETPECEQCLKGNEPKLKWVWIVYLREAKQVKILDCGSMLGDAICQLAKEKKLDPQEFDIIVTKTGTNLKTKYFAKIGKISKLTEDEQKPMKNMKLFLIKKYLTPKSE